MSAASSAHGSTQLAQHPVVCTTGTRSHLVEWCLLFMMGQLLPWARLEQRLGVLVVVAALLLQEGHSRHHHMCRLAHSPPRSFLSQPLLLLARVQQLLRSSTMHMAVRLQQQQPRAGTVTAAAAALAVLVALRHGLAPALQSSLPGSTRLHVQALHWVRFKSVAKI